MVPIYGITLRTTPERHSQGIDETEKIGWDVEWLVRDRDPRGGIYGCWESHVAAWTLARSRGEPIVMVIEDDMVCTDHARAMELTNAMHEAVRAFDIDATLEAVSLVPIHLILHDERDCRIPTTNIYKHAYTVFNLCYIIHVDRVFARIPPENMICDGQHIDVSMWSHTNHPLSVVHGVFSPTLPIFTRCECDTVRWDGQWHFIPPSHYIFFQIIL